MEQAPKPSIANPPVKPAAIGRGGWRQAIKQSRISSAAAFDLEITCPAPGEPFAKWSKALARVVSFKLWKRAARAKPKFE